MHCYSGIIFWLLKIQLKFISSGIKVYSKIGHYFPNGQIYKETETTVKISPIPDAHAQSEKRLKQKRFGLVSFVSWHIKLRRIFTVKTILSKKQLWYNLTHSCGHKGFHTFSKGISPKVNEIARLEDGYIILDIIPQNSLRDKLHI